MKLQYLREAEDIREAARALLHPRQVLSQAQRRLPEVRAAVAAFSLVLGGCLIWIAGAVYLALRVNWSWAWAAAPPVALMVLLFLSLRRSYTGREWVSSLELEPQREQPVVLQINHTGIDYRSPIARLELPWRAVQLFIPTPNLLLITSAEQTIIVPRRAFTNQAEVKAFEHLVRSHMPRSGPVSSQSC